MKKSKKIIAVIVAILAVSGCWAGFRYWQDSKGPKPVEKADLEKQVKNYEDIRKTMAEESSDPAKRKIDFAALREMNPDIYAWIYIPGTSVDYPVLQSSSGDDSYYLNTTVDGKAGLPGSIYTEQAYNGKDFTDPVTVIYGHTLDQGVMFDDLHKYADREFFDANPYIYIYLPDKTLKYQVFAAVAFDDRHILESNGYVVPEAFQSYADELRSSIDGNVNNDVPVAQEGTILTLSTCITESPNQRWLVNATLAGQ